MADGDMSVDELLDDLQNRLKALVEAARKEGADSALAEIRNVVSNRLGDDAKPAAKSRKKSSRKKTTRKSSSKKSASKDSDGKKKTKKKRRNPWDHMTPEQRKERVRKMLAGRGLKPKDER